MKIGELAKQTGLAPSRIRFYEQIGLLKMVTRKSNGYRSYPPEAAVVLDLITNAQNAGFSLDELRTLLPSDLAQWDHSSLVDALRQKVQDIEALQERLQRSKAQVLELLSEIEAKPEDMDCAAHAARVMAHFGLGETNKPTSDSDDIKATDRP